MADLGAAPEESYPGLLAGLGLLRYFCEHHWSEVHPGKPRTRGAAFGWLVLRLEPLFTLSLPLQNQQPLFQAVLEHLIRLDELWAEHLGDAAPMLLPIRRQLAQRLERAAQDDAPVAGLSGVIAHVKQATTQLLKPEARVDNEKDAHRLLRTLQEQARTLCVWWLRQNATDLRAFRLNRTLTWLALANYPDADNERLTALRGPLPTSSSVIRSVLPKVITPIWCSNLKPVSPVRCSGSMGCTCSGNAWRPCRPNRP